MRIALGLEYDGAPFHGWQSQADGSGVQDALERAVGEIAGARVATIAAGRTDSGVHATLQVVHFDAPAARPESAWVRGVNALLPATVAVRWALEVADDISRPLQRHRTPLHLYAARITRCVRRSCNRVSAGTIARWHWGRCEEGAQALLGTHDFSAFRAAECQAKSPVKRLDRLEILREGDMLRFELHADAFLQHMVRNIIGTLVAVGMRSASSGVGRRGARES